MKALNEEENLEIPMTPMIDIVFQLLIFFLLATTIQEEELDLTVKLPAARQGTTAQTGVMSPMYINVRKDGTVSLGNQPITHEELKKKLQEAGTAAKKPAVFVRGDRATPYDSVFDIVQLCREANLTDVTLRGSKE